MKSILVLLSLLSFSVSAQQVQNTDRFRISWQANPAADNIAWYIVKWDDGRPFDEMPVITETSDTSFTIGVDWFRAEEGDEVCVRLQAARDVERSIPSERACIVYNRDVGVATLSTPTGLTIELMRR